MEMSEPYKIQIDLSCALNEMRSKGDKTCEQAV